jgi:hypothetical protein
MATEGDRRSVDEGAGRGFVPIVFMDGADSSGERQ